MSKWSKPEMKVIRFKEADVIVASGAVSTKDWSGFGDGIASNAVVKFNGISYTIDSQDVINQIISATGRNNPGINNGESTMSVKKLLGHELEGTVSSKRWNGNYVYDPNATWNNGTKDLKGLFTKQ